MIGLLKSLTGFCFAERRYARFRWGEVTARGWGLGLAVTAFDDHWSLSIYPGFGSIYFRVWPARGTTLGDDLSYGFSWYWGREWGNGDSIHLNWGTRCKILHMPWGWEWQRTSLLAADGRSWIHDLKGFNKWRAEDVPIGYPATDDKWFFFDDLPHWQVTLPYLYTLRNGEQQRCDATISVDEREWRMRWLQWLPWPRLVRRYIDVKFSDEVGERAGSWKGGCVGCSHDLHRDETPQQCLARMMRDRKFD
jgi:hypothetical protein